MRAKPVTFKRARTLRRQMTLPEIVLWQRLRNRELGDLHFRHQHPVGPYILDFYCSSARLCVEVDGQIHGHRDIADHDERRTKWLARKGIRVLRFAAVDVLRDENLEGVLIEIAQAAAPSTA